MSKPKFTTDYYGAEITDILAGTLVPVYNEGARIRFKRFTYVVPAGGVAATKTIALGIVPKNAHIIGGAIKFSSMGGSATISLGLAGADASGYIDTSVADAPTMFINALSVVSASQGYWAELGAGSANALYLTAKECILYATANTSTFPQAGTITVVMKYVLD